VLVATLISAGNALIRYSLGESSNAWLEIQWYLFGAMFLLPMAVLLAWLAWPMFYEAWITQEHSPDAGGLLRWPVKLLLPLGFSLLALQGVAEVIKRIGVLRGHLVLSREAPEEEV